MRTVQQILFVSSTVDVRKQIIVIFPVTATPCDDFKCALKPELIAEDVGVEHVPVVVANVPGFHFVAILESHGYVALILDETVHQ